MYLRSGIYRDFLRTLHIYFAYIFLVVFFQIDGGKKEGLSGSIALNKVNLGNLATELFPPSDDLFGTAEER